MANALLACEACIDVPAALGLMGRNDLHWCKTCTRATLGGVNNQQPMSEVTRILNSIEQGDARAADELLPLVYGELRRLAAQKMTREAPGHTLQPTALVHEAWLRLAGDQNQQWDSRGHFFSAAAEAMRRILIEHARAKKTVKRGVDFERVNFETLDAAILAEGEEFLLLNDALEKLEREEPAAAQVVKLRFFAGMTNEEAGQVLGVTDRTAKRYWTFARAWLFRELRRRTGETT